MPRAADGTYSLAPLNPVVRGDPIVIDWANPTMDDIEAALTDSLSRSGKGPMLAPLTLLNSTPTVALHAASKGYVDARPPGEAPTDGKQYSRKNSAWVEVTPFPEAPINGLQYARKDAAWAQVTPFPEAPVDGQQYARKDAAWSMVTASAAGSAGEWTFNTTLTPPPSSGQIRLNTADQTVATTLYISDLTAPGSDLGNYLTRSLVAKSRLYIQDKDDSSKYQFYRLQADSVAASGYHSVAISWLSGGGALSAQRVLMSILPQASNEFGSLAYNNFTVDDTAPAVPKVGDRWVRPATGDEMVRIPTGDGAGAWIDPGASQIPLPLAVASGGTAGTTAAAALTNLGIASHDKIVVDATAPHTKLNVIANAATGWSMLQLCGLAPGRANISGYKDSIISANIRWGIDLVNSDPESSGNAGSNFSIIRYADNGAVLGNVLSISRATGATTLNGVLTVYDPGSPQLIVNSPAGVNRFLVYKTNGSTRWAAYASSAAESGSNLGSDYLIARYNDAGTYVDDPFVIRRSSGAVSVGPFNSQSSFQSAGVDLPNQSGLPDWAATIRVGAIGSSWASWSDQYGKPVIQTEKAAADAAIFLWRHVVTSVGYAGAFGMYNGSSTSLSYFRFILPGSVYHCDLHANGEAYRLKGSTSWLITSDARLKENIEDYKVGLQEVLQLQPRTFTYRPETEQDTSERHISFIAQECESVIPEMVKIRASEMGSLKFEDMRILDVAPVTYALVNAVKELATRLATLEAK